jgi:hypothetical protein
MKKSILGLAMVLVLLFAGTCNALLHDRGNGMIYDDVRNRTWYNYSFACLGWQSAATWANNLSITYNGVVFTDWRLPKAKNKDGSGPCTGYYCKGSELGNLFYTILKNKGMYTVDGLYQTGYGLKIRGLLTNLKSAPYWEGPKDLYWWDRGGQWAFAMNTGYQGIAAKNTTVGTYAIAVRKGDILADSLVALQSPAQEDMSWMEAEELDPSIWFPEE